MKIGFFGNTNNYPFTFAMGLRNMGHSVVFVVTARELLHRPEGSFSDFRDGYPEWIVDISHLSELEILFLHKDLAGALAKLADCDALVMNSHGPSLIPFLNKPAITLLTGSDLYYYASYSLVEKRVATATMEYKGSPEGRSVIATLHDFVTRQRMGIRNSVSVSYFPRGCMPQDDLMLDEIGVSDDRRVALKIANLGEIAFTPAPHGNPVRIFCGTRLTWKLPVAPTFSLLDYKGGDIMIKGLGLFYRETGMRLDIHLVRKGLHVEETESLIDREGLHDQVTWSREMSQMDYFKEIVSADIVIDQLGDAVPGVVSFDAMSMGRPVIANVKNLFSDVPEPSPICQAKTPEEFCIQLKRLVFNAQERENVGRQGRRYVETYLNPEQAASKIVDIFRESLVSGSTQKTLSESNYAYLFDQLKKLREPFVGELSETQIELERARYSFSRLEQELNQSLATLAHYKKYLKLLFSLVDAYVKWCKPLVDAFLRRGRFRNV